MTRKLRLWIATCNRGKTREFMNLVGDRWRVRGLHGVLGLPVIRETGKTFAANAKIKALAISRAIPTALVLADDSGLVVPGLRGRPGVRSARFAGPRTTDQDNRRKLLRLLKDRTGSERKAYFQASLVLARNGRILGIAEGRVWGQITPEEQGKGGFGYDPIFRPQGFQKTFGELPSRTKDRISHRAKAMRGLVRVLSNIKAIPAPKKRI
ncbi:MAG: RdgB/HAM1 family non-canonical purine NTP pyrophosphatase [Verrucomicrobia bacterium]|nr:RdgB/HAM1 family non-canonical purine NTP pyrophosphatase [Verrucomicrobiota bacterium]